MLLVVMPVYNEQAAIEVVVREWVLELDQQVGNFILLVIDDGSTDSTRQILKRLEVEFGARLECISRPNLGHGQTCIQGYSIALERNIPFILQIDSDGQSDPQYFAQFWIRRKSFDVVYGKRRRSDGCRRVLASFTLRILLLIIARVNCVDANVPYRLMNTTSCADAIHKVPADLFLANIGLAVILRKSPSIRHGDLPIGFPPRRGGEPSVGFSKFAAKAFELFSQLKKAGIW